MFYLGEDSLEVLLLFLQSPKCWDDGYVLWCWVYEVLQQLESYNYCTRENAFVLLKYGRLFSMLQAYCHSCTQ